MVLSETGQATSPEVQDPESRDLYLILFPTGYEESIIELLDSIGVPGFSEGPELLGRGAHGRHFNNPVWPGSTGEIFTAIDARQGEVLMQHLRMMNDELQRKSQGLQGLHVLSWPCQLLL
jgi:hypothetical protein